MSSDPLSVERKDLRPVENHSGAKVTVEIPASDGKPARAYILDNADVQLSFCKLLVDVTEDDDLYKSFRSTEMTIAMFVGSSFNGFTRKDVEEN